MIVSFWFREISVIVKYRDSAYGKSGYIVELVNWQEISKRRERERENWTHSAKRVETDTTDRLATSHTDNAMLQPACNTDKIRRYSGQ